MAARQDLVSERLRVTVTRVGRRGVALAEMTWRRVRIWSLLNDSESPPRVPDVQLVGFPDSALWLDIAPLDSSLPSLASQARVRRDIACHHMISHGSAARFVAPVARELRRVRRARSRRVTSHVIARGILIRRARCTRSRM